MDLLNENVTVGQWLGVAHRAVFRGDCAIDGQDGAHARPLLLKGDNSKTRAATAMNQRSSWAHMSALALSHAAAQHIWRGGRELPGVGRSWLL